MGNSAKPIIRQLEQRQRSNELLSRSLSQILEEREKVAELEAGIKRMQEAFDADPNSVLYRILLASGWTTAEFEEMSDLQYGTLLWAASDVKHAAEGAGYQWVGDGFSNGEWIVSGEMLRERILEEVLVPAEVA